MAKAEKADGAARRRSGTNIRRPRRAKYRDDESISASTHVFAHDARTALINGICHRALRCISRFTHAPPGLCLALCFAPSVRPVPGMRHGCIRSRSSEALVDFYPLFPHFSLLSLITLVALLMLCLRSPYVIPRGRGIFYVAPANCHDFPQSVCYDTLLNTVFIIEIIPAYSRIRLAHILMHGACFLVFFLFLAFNGNTFRCLCRGKNETRQGLTKQRYTERVLSRSVECTDEPFIFQYLILKHRDHPSRIRPALAKTRDFCHRVMYDPASSRIAHRTSVENNCLSCP